MTNSLCRPPWATPEAHSATAREGPGVSPEGLEPRGRRRGPARKGLREGVSRGQSRSTAHSGSGEARGARSAGLTAQPEREQVNRSVWPREATPGHHSKLGGRSGRTTRDINKATRERANGHPHPVTPPAPQQSRSRPGRASLLGLPLTPWLSAPIAGCSPCEVPRAAHLGRPPARTARLPAAAAALPATGAAPALRRLPRRRLRAHLAGLPSLSGTLRSRTRPRPQPGPDSPAREGSAPSRSQPVRLRASQTRGHTPGHARAPLARPQPRARARAPQTLLGCTQWALNKC